MNSEELEADVAEGTRRNYVATMLRTEEHEAQTTSRHVALMQCEACVTLKNDAVSFEQVERHIFHLKVKTGRSASR